MCQIDRSIKCLIYINQPHLQYSDQIINFNRNENVKLHFNMIQSIMNFSLEHQFFFGIYG